MLTAAACLLAGLVLGALAASLATAVIVGGSADDAYRRGRLDERADALARELWDEELPFGGTD